MSQIPPQEVELQHKPFITLAEPLEKDKETELTIRVGRIPHPMEEGHYIEWIKIYQNGKLAQEINLNPEIDKEAKAFFSFLPQGDFSLEIKAKCNLHGVWTKEIQPKDLIDLQVVKEF